MQKRRIACVGCEVFARDLFRAAAESAHTTVVQIRLLPQGLHDRPKALRREIQREIDAAAASDERTAAAAATALSAVVLAFGTCGTATVGLRAPATVPLVVPRRFHDCLDVLLLSPQRTATTLHCNRDAVERRGRCGLWVDAAIPPRAELEARGFSAENAAFLAQCAEDAARKYDRVLYVAAAAAAEGGSAEAEEMEWARSQALQHGWRFEVAEAPPWKHAVLRRLLHGEWDRFPEDFLVVPPQHTIALDVEDAVLSIEELR